MTLVETVRGPVDAGALGVTLMHEHVFVRTPDLAVDLAGEWDEDAAVAAAVDRLGRLPALGIRTIVDPTVIGLGRDVRVVRRVAERVDLNVVAATGLYTYDELPARFRMAPRGAGDPLLALMIGDLTEGIAGTGIRAAFLKCAIDAPGLTPGVERVLRTVAAAHRATGAPITVHTHARSRSGLVAQDVLAGEGVDLGAVVIGHSGDSTDLDYLRRLADRGSLLGMDRFGIDSILPTGQRVATVAAMCADGYADRMVLSHDASCHIDWFPPGRAAELEPDWHYEHLHRRVIPELRDRGVTDAQLHAMLVEAPRRYFGGAP